MDHTAVTFTKHVLQMFPVNGVVSNLHKGGISSMVYVK